MISKQSTIPVPDSLYIGASKNYFYLLFLIQIFHSWWYETYRVIHQKFWMKECDILGGQNIFWTHPTYFQGEGQDPRNPPWSTPLPCRRHSPIADHTRRWDQTTPVTYMRRWPGLAWSGGPPAQPTMPRHIQQTETDWERENARRRASYVLAAAAGTVLLTHAAARRQLNSRLSHAQPRPYS